MLTPESARTAILSARCAVVYFTKADGTLRRMVCHVPDYGDVRAFSRTPLLLTVWDVEKGGIRTVNLATVKSIKPVRTRRPTDRWASPRESDLLPSRSAADIAALFDNRA